MVRTRRAVLGMGAASLAALAGCNGGSGSDGGDGNGDGNGGGGGNSGPFPDHTDVTDIFYEKDETIEIPAGSFTSYSIDFENGGALKYDFTVTDGPAIDVLMIGDGEFDYFKDGHEVNYNAAHSVQDGSDGSSSSGISSGSYRLIFDNSEMGKAKPPTPESTPESTAEEGTEETADGESSEDSSGGSSGAGAATVELTITAGQ
ncbi:hypothetical protein [Halosimplex sp. J119]